MPSASVKRTSEGTPRIVEVIGATVIEDKYAIALSLVRTTTVFACPGEESDRAGYLHALSLLRPRCHPLPARHFSGVVRALLITSPIAGFQLLRFKALQVFAKRPANERRTVHLRAPSGAIGGAKQVGI